MHIDVTARIDEAKRLTADWATAAGYVPVETDEPAELSKKAKDVRRVLAVSDFGCQERSVHALVEVLLGEKFPAPSRNDTAQYLTPVRPVIGTVLVPVTGEERAGRVTRLSTNLNANLMKSNGEVFHNRYAIASVRPATPLEIETYFAEFFGVEINAADVPRAPGLDVDEGTPF